MQEGDATIQRRCSIDITVLDKQQGTGNSGGLSRSQQVKEEGAWRQLYMKKIKQPLVRTSVRKDAFGGPHVFALGQYL